jgi:thiamine biosynthesis lipoprotein
MISLIVIVIAGSVLVLSKAGNRDSLDEQTRFLMDTYCTIQAYGPGRDVHKAVSKALDRMEEIDKEFNALNPLSPIYAFNKKNIPVTDHEILGVVKLAQQVSEECDGAFDITVYPLGELWGFYSGDSLDMPDKVFKKDDGSTTDQEMPEIVKLAQQINEQSDDTLAITVYPLEESWGPDRLPEKEEIDDCMSRVGYKNIVLKNGKLIKVNQDVYIDLGAIAKGYAIEEASKVLKAEGIKSALIDAGGDIYAMGEVEGKGWGIGIRDPRGEGVIAVIQGSDLAVVTSGDYERFFVRDGIRYCHIVDPRTGYPSRKLISVTVIHPLPMIADAWATALFVVGAEEGIKLVEQIPDMETLMVTPDEQVLYSSGLKENLEVLRQK